MQHRGWGLTRASRIVIILLVVQHLGLAQGLAFAPVTPAGPDPADALRAIAALDVDLPLLAVTDAACRASAAIRDDRSGAIPPDPVPLPCRLSRAPPAA